MMLRGICPTPGASETHSASNATIRVASVGFGGFCFGLAGGSALPPSKRDFSSSASWELDSISLMLRSNAVAADGQTCDGESRHTRGARRILAIGEISDYLISRESPRKLM